MTDSAELAAMMGRFGKAYTRWLAKQLEHTGTTPARARLLLALSCEGALKMSDLGVQLGVTPRSITKLVDALEGEGLVLRAAHPTDRRATMIHLTPNGKSVCKQILLSSEHGAVTALYDDLSPADRNAMARLLRKLIACLAARGEEA